MRGQPSGNLTVVHVILFPSSDSVVIPAMKEGIMRKWPASWVEVWEVVDEEMKMFCTPDCLIDYFTARTLLGGIHD